MESVASRIVVSLVRPGPAISLALVSASALAGASVFPLAHIGAVSNPSAAAEGWLSLAGWWLALVGWAMLFAALLRRMIRAPWERCLYLSALCHLPLLLCLALASALLGAEEAFQAYSHSALGRQLFQPLARDYVLLAPLGAQVALLAAHRWRAIAARLPIVAILLVAMALRLSHAAWGLPGLLHPDEARYFGPSTMMVARGQLNPQYFENPSVMIYVACLLFWLLTEHSIAFQQLNGFLNLGIQDPRGDFLQMVMLRGVVGVAGTATVLAVYLAGRELVGRAGALAAAALLGLSMLHVRDSHYATNDVLATCLLALSFLFAVRVYRRGTLPDYLLAGLLGGLATSTKYNAGLFAVAIVVAHWRTADRRPQTEDGETGGRGEGEKAQGTRHKAQGDGLRNPEPRTQNSPRTQPSEPSPQSSVLSPQHAARSTQHFFALLASGVASLAGFLVGTPFALLDYPRFLADFRSQLGYGAEPWRGQEAGSSALAFLATLIQGFGLVPLGLAAIGALLWLRRDRWGAALLLSTPLAYLLFMSTQHLFFARFAIPTLPYLALLAGFAVRLLCDSPARWARVGASLLLVVALVQPLAFAWRHDLLLGRADTRLLAASWVDANLPRDTSLAVESHAHADGKFGWKGHGVENTWLFWPENEQALAEAIGGEYRYVMVSSFGYEPMKERDDPSDRLPAAFEPLEQRGKLVARFGPGPGGGDLPYSLDDMYTPYWHLFDQERPGPTVRIYRME